MFTEVPVNKEEFDLIYFAVTFAFAKYVLYLFGMVNLSYATVHN